MGAAILASVDGEILPPEEATISILDDGLLRGDGAFEVIKLYGAPPVPPRRPRRPPAPLRRRDPSRLRRAGAPGRDRGAARRRRRSRRLPADRDHARRPPAADDRAGSRLARQRPDRPRHADPERDPRRGQVDLLRGEHARDPARRRARRRRGRLRRRRRHGAGGADLLDLLDRRRRPPADARPRGRDPRLDHPRRRRRGTRRRGGHVPEAGAARRPGRLPRLDDREIQPVSAIDGEDLETTGDEHAAAAAAALRDAVARDRSEAEA